MNNNLRLLIAEDDAAIREGLCDALASEGYDIRAAANGNAALTLLRESPADLILLDVMMPGLSGYDVCRAIRKTDAHTPILFLTAKGEEIDKVVGLELGADDYMTKPFGVRELLARVHALLRRSRLAAPSDTSPEKAAFDFGPTRIDPRTYTVTLGQHVSDLSPREMTLLRFFAAHPDEALSRDELLNAAWGITYYGTTRTLDQHIAQLRKKIEPNREEPTVILTLHGIGYKYQTSPAF